MCRLQGIITNDPKLLQNGAKDVLYTALLNSQGRFMHDAFLYATGDTHCTMLKSLDNVVPVTCHSTPAAPSGW